MKWQGCGILGMLIASSSYTSMTSEGHAQRSGASVDTRSGKVYATWRRATISGLARGREMGIATLCGNPSNIGTGTNGTLVGQAAMPTVVL